MKIMIMEGRKGRNIDGKQYIIDKKGWMEMKERNWYEVNKNEHNDYQSIINDY